MSQSTSGRFAELTRTFANGIARIERLQVCQGGMSKPQFDLLCALQDSAEGLATSALAERQGVDLSTTSRSLAILERDGYVRRARGRKDARQVVNQLTAKGRRVALSMCADEKTVFDAIFSRLPKARRAEVIAALEQLSAAVEPETSQKGLA